MMEDKREFRRFPRYATNIVCSVTFPDEPSSYEVRLRDISVVATRLQVQPAAQGLPPEPHGSATLSLKGRRMPIRVYSRAWSMRHELIASFEKPMSDTELIELLGGVHTVGTSLPGTIEFEAKINIEEISFFDTMVQLMNVFAIIDVAYQIQAELHSIQYQGDLVLAPPHLRYLQSASPLRGAIGTTKEVVEIIRAADDLIRNRSENKKLKHEEVIQEREKSRQEGALAETMESGAFVRRYTKRTDVLRAQAELIQKTVELEREELALLREKLSLLSDGVDLARKLFSEDSSELKLIKDKLLPYLAGLLSESPLQVHLLYPNLDTENTTKTGDR